VLDFAFRRAAIDTITGRAGTDLWTTVFAGDQLYDGGAAATLKMPTFLGNHDFGRFAFEMRQAFPKADDSEIMKRVELGNAMLFALRGVPVIYAGDEQGFVGDGGDQDAREDMFASKVAVYNDNHLIGTKSTTAQSNFDSAHPLYVTLAELSKLRSAHPALRRGAQIIRNYSEKPGLFAVSRVDEATKEDVLIVFNTSNAPLSANVELDPRTKGLTSLTGDCPAAIAVPGSAAFHLPPLGYAICKTQ
jgi:neopullulanase